MRMWPQLVLCWSHFGGRVTLIPYESAPTYQINTVANQYNFCYTL